MKIKRPFALKTDKIFSGEIKKCASAFKTIENIAPEIAKMFVEFGKMARECKQLLKEADKILSECGKDEQNEKYVEVSQKYNNKKEALLKYYNEHIIKKANELKDESDIIFQ